MPNKRTERPWERQKGESAQAFEAFFLYLEMGADRSIRAVSQELGKSKTLIDRWSRTHNWVERCRAWDNQIRQEQIWTNGMSLWPSRFRMRLCWH